MTFPSRHILAWTRPLQPWHDASGGHVCIDRSNGMLHRAQPVSAAKWSINDLVAFYSPFRFLQSPGLRSRWTSLRSYPFLVDLIPFGLSLIVSPRRYITYQSAVRQPLQT